jgi:molecular chaperone GrpE
MAEHEENDVVVETEAGDDGIDEGDDRAEGKVAKLRSELARCRAEKQEYMDGWQRAKADYVNLLKRSDEATAAARAKGKTDAVETLLPAFDALERAKEHGEIPEGFAAIAKQLESAFASLGLEAIGVEGEPFDPARHDALGTDPAESAEKDDTLSAVLEKGWRVGDAVIRPAKVRVAHVES